MSTGKETIAHNVMQDAAKVLSMPDWSLSEMMALACRILAREDHSETLAGQITARDPGGQSLWTAPLGVAFDEVLPSDLILVDEELAVLQGDGMPNPAVRFHWWVYRQRPDVQCIVHTHPPYAAALSMLEVPLEVSHMDAAMLYDDCAFLAEWPGVPIADYEGELISGALGDKRTILLAHHGILAAGSNVQEATYLASNLERAARMQLRAMQAGQIKPVDPHCARDAHDFLLKPAIVNATFHSYARRVIRQDPRNLAALA